MTLTRIGWQNGTLVESAKVLDDGTVQPAVYEGTTKLSASNLAQMEDNTENYVQEYVGEQVDLCMSKPVVLYENTTGTKSNNITLSDSAANYEYLEFFCDYNAENSRLISTKAYNPDGKTVNFTISESYSSGSSRYFYVWTSTIEVSGSTITQGNAGQIQFINQTINTNNSSSYIYITRVLGYK